MPVGLPWARRYRTPKRSAHQEGLRPHGEPGQETRTDPEGSCKNWEPEPKNHHANPSLFDIRQSSSGDNPELKEEQSEHTDKELTKEWFNACESHVSGEKSCPEGS